MVCPYIFSAQSSGRGIIRTVSFIRTRTIVFPPRCEDLVVSSDGNVSGTWVTVPLGLSG